MNKTGAYTLFIGLLLSAIVYFGEAPERILGTSTALQNDVNAVPFAVARNTKTTHYQKNGDIGYSFTAKRLEHYRESNDENTDASEASVFTLIDAPVIVINREEEPWYVEAEKGKVTTADQNILLWHNILVKHTSIDGVITTITTEKLWIDPIKRLANTPEPVKISSDKLEMTGIGLEADLIEESLNVLSNVHGIYDPT